MQFTSPRRVTLAHLGHVVAFDKGQTINLPEALHQIALEQGLEPAEEIAREAKTDDSERHAALKAAMAAIAKQNKSTDFDAGGIPKKNAVESLAGTHKLKDNDERLKLWAEAVNGIEA